MRGPNIDSNIPYSLLSGTPNKIPVILGNPQRIVFPEHTYNKVCIRIHIILYRSRKPLMIRIQGLGFRVKGLGFRV